MADFEAVKEAMRRSVSESLKSPKIRAVLRRNREMAMDFDAIKRTLADLEKRVALLENRERKAPMTFGPAPARDDHGFCECGRDGCRWPYCKARENSCGNDPLGR